MCFVPEDWNIFVESHLEGSIQHSTHTRSSQSNRLYVPRRDLCVSRKSLRYNGAILYNTLNSKIQDCGSLGAFKFYVFEISDTFLSDALEILGSDQPTHPTPRLVHLLRVFYTWKGWMLSENGCRLCACARWLETVVCCKTFYILIADLEIIYASLTTLDWGVPVKSWWS